MKTKLKPRFEASDFENNVLGFYNSATGTVQNF